MDYALIFDMDGVLVNTEGLHCPSCIDAFSRYGITLTEDEYRNALIHVGVVDTDIEQEAISTILKERKICIDPRKIKEQKMFEYRRRLHENDIKIEGVGQSLATLYDHFPLGLASSSDRPTVDIVLDLTDFRRYFSATVSSSESKRLKPDPTCCVMASELLGVERGNCLVVEDSEIGISAAKAAGIKVVAVPNEYTAGNDFSGAVKIIKSLKEITPEMVGGILSE